MYVIATPPACPPPPTPPLSRTISQLKIVDPYTKLEVHAGEEGEVWLSSPSVAAGYWGLPELTKEAFGARIARDGGVGAPGRVSGSGECDGGENDGEGPVFLRTGDLARVDSEGHLLISGRLKDLIIIKGRNLYPQVRKGKSAKKFQKIRRFFAEGKNRRTNERTRGRENDLLGFSEGPPPFQLSFGWFGHFVTR